MARALHEAGYSEVVRAENASMARHCLQSVGPFALVICNIRMPDESGLKLLEELAPMAPETVVMMETSGHGLMTAIEALKLGAYDYLLKPFDVEALQLSVGNVLKRRQRELEERSDRHRFEEMLEARLNTLQKTRKALLRAICRLAEFGRPQAHVHPERVARYSYLIAEQLAHNSPYAPFVTREFLHNISECAVLHDIGKLALPSSLLQKPAALTAEERQSAEQHAELGREICQSVREEVDSEEGDFIRMAIEVTGSHHERWDGGGYPDGLAGTDIPLSGRIVGVADFYDVLRRPMVYRPEVFPREEVAAKIQQQAGSKFDPVVVRAFLDVASAVSEAEGAE